MTVIVQTTDNSEISTGPEQMAALSGSVFPASERVPGVVGEAFDLEAWYAALIADRIASTDSLSAQPTHLIVRAADEFQAVVPWRELQGACFLYAVGGAPLSKGGPLRLYVPDGSSACLNVKSVRHIRFASDAGFGQEALYGFRNEISPTRMSQGYKNGG